MYELLSYHTGQRILLFFSFLLSFLSSEEKVFDFSEGLIFSETLTLEEVFSFSLRDFPLSCFALEEKELIFSEILTLERAFFFPLRGLSLSCFASEKKGLIFSETLILIRAFFLQGRTVMQSNNEGLLYEVIFILFLLWNFISSIYNVPLISWLLSC